MSGNSRAYPTCRWRTGWYDHDAAGKPSPSRPPSAYRTTQLRRYGVARCFAKIAPVDRWRGAQLGGKLLPQGQGRTKAGLRSNAFNGQVCGFQQLLRPCNPLGIEPAVDCGAGCLPEASGEGQALAQYDPQVIVINAGYAMMSDFEDSIIMGKEDVLRASRVAPQATIVATDAINHMAQTRKELREYVQEKGIQDRVQIPEDGATVQF